MATLPAELGEGPLPGPILFLISLAIVKNAWK